MKRRTFLKSAGLLLTVPVLGRPSFFDNSDSIHIFHTNDTHSRIDPFPASDRRNAGKGGVARRSTLFSKMRQRYANTLFFDCGDVFQGTPYFNYYEGRLDYMLMSKMGYDAGTLGNHDFDNGVVKLNEAMKYAEFDIITSNFRITDPVSMKKVIPYKVYVKSGIRVGVFGLGIDFDGLVTDNNHQGYEYLDYKETAEKMVSILRKQEQVHVVVCLSHLGVRSDIDLAEHVSGIDVLLGGHSHTFMESPLNVNHNGWITLIHQVGFGGLRVGHIELYFGKDGSIRKAGAGSYEVG